jgi:hypothetical protein
MGIEIHVEDRLLGHARFHRGSLGDSCGMAEIRRGSNGTGMMYCGPKRGRVP